MSEGRTTANDRIARIWDRFVDRARKNGVNEPALRWNVRPADAYVKAFPGKRLALHRWEDLTGYPGQAGRLGGIKERRFVQIVDAVENWLVTAKAPVTVQVDWGALVITPATPFMRLARHDIRILIRSKRQGLIGSVGTLLEQVRSEAGFRVSPAMVERVQREAGKQ